MPSIAVLTQRDARTDARNLVAATDKARIWQRGSDFLVPPSPTKSKSPKQKQAPISTSRETEQRLPPPPPSPRQKHPLLSPQSSPSPKFLPRPPHRKSSSVSSLTISHSNAGRRKFANRDRCSSSPSTLQRERVRSYSNAEHELDDVLSNVKIRTQVLGASHPKVGLSWNQVGNSHFRHGDHKTALKAYRQALVCFIAAHGGGVDEGQEDAEDKELAQDMPDHVDIAATLGNIGTVFWAMGRLADAARCLERSLQMRIRMASSAGESIDESAEIASALYRLGLAHCLCCEYDKSMKVLEQSHQIYTTIFGPGHIEVAQIVDAMGKVHLCLGDVDKAMDCHQEALVTKRSLLGRLHPSVLSAMMNIAAAYGGRGEFDDALEMYEEVLSAQRSISTREKHDPTRSCNNALDVAVTLQIIGEVLVSLGDMIESKVSFKEALLMYKEAGLPADDIRIKNLVERQSSMGHHKGPPNKPGCGH